MSWLYKACHAAVAADPSLPWLLKGNRGQRPVFWATSLMCYVFSCGKCVSISGMWTSPLSALQTPISPSPRDGGTLWGSLSRLANIPTYICMEIFHLNPHTLVGMAPLPPLGRSPHSRLNNQVFCLWLLFNCH